MKHILNKNTVSNVKSFAFCCESFYTLRNSTNGRSLLLEPMTEFPIDFENTSLYAEEARKS